MDEIPCDAGVICVCPSHQFPLGIPLSPLRRQALLDLARQTGAVIVEDDYDGEFRYGGSPLEALRGEASADHVFYVGSFSKCMLPAIRLGFLVAPRWALSALVAAKNASDWHCSSPIQTAVGGFIRDGHLARHIRRVRRIYLKRRDHLVPPARPACRKRAEGVAVILRHASCRDCRPGDGLCRCRRSVGWHAG